MKSTLAVSLPSRHKHIQIHHLKFVCSVLLLSGDREAVCVTLLGGKTVENCPCKHYLTFWQK